MPTPPTTFQPPPEGASDHCLSKSAVPDGGAARFASVGLIGMFVDLLAFEGLFALGVSFITAHVISFCVATVTNFYLNSRWALSESARADGGRAGEIYMRCFTVCLLALAIRGGVLAATWGSFGVSAQVATLCAIGAAAIVSHLGSAFFVFPSANPRVTNEMLWRMAAIGVAIYVIVLRLLFLGLADLMPQEAYYWNYAQHLDIGYLDHPPMVAWLIWAGTHVFGDNEFGVRIAAWLCWFATSVFSFRLTDRMYGKSAASVSLLLVAALPFYFASGFLMTPDAPLTAAWAGALYFLQRALIDGQRNAWWGIGICIGLGLLSKYTIALLGPATLLFMLVDMRARAWLKRPEPYLAAILALLIFSPAIYWNLEHGLASFAFQSTRRIQGVVQFSVPQLIVFVAILLTPPGLMAAVAALWASRRRASAESPDESARRISRFILVFTLLPLAVFVVFSLQRGVKLNWTGPLWLAVLPAISMAILGFTERASSFERKMRRVWVATIAISLVSYGLALNYFVLGIPGLGYPVKLPAVPVAWKEFWREAAAVKREVHQATGAEPLMIGLDAYNIASELAFYGKDDGKGATNSVGRYVLGRGYSLMYAYWYPVQPMYGRTAVMFAFNRFDIYHPVIAYHFSTVGNPVEREVIKNGKPAGRFYYRIGYGLRASP